jgi:hypothetical protein
MCASGMAGTADAGRGLGMLRRVRLLALINQSAPPRRPSPTTWLLLPPSGTSHSQSRPSRNSRQAPARNSTPSAPICLAPTGPRVPQRPSRPMTLFHL